VGDEKGGLAPVWARSGEQIATAATKKRIRIIRGIISQIIAAEAKGFI